LDEIGDLPFSIQAKLLRAIQFKQVEKIGGSQTIPTDVRIIVATNKNLTDEVKAGRFREDLYYRLSVIPIEMPPLRERKKEALFLLMEQFLSSFCAHYHYEVVAYSPEVMMICYQYNWPGNIRELKNAVEHAFVLSLAENFGRILPRHLPGGILSAIGWKNQKTNEVHTGELKVMMKNSKMLLSDKSW
jgi:transcriptional regulator with GAF, ATPase, and Fis domain